MHERLRAVALVAGSLVFGIWLAGATGLAEPPPGPVSLEYRVTVAPDSGFAVELRMHGRRGRRPEFRLLEGWGLLQDQGAHIEDLWARDETGSPLPVYRRPEGGETRWRLGRQGKGDLHLTYRVRPFDPDVSPEASFAASDRFLLLGTSLFLMPAGIRPFDPIPITVEIRTPDDWPLWSSWPGARETYVPPTFHDLWSGVAAGGAFRPSRVEAGPVSVTVLTEKPIPDLLGLGVANRLFPGLREMVELFGAPPRGDSLRVLAVYRAASPREPRSMLSGCSEEGAFLCLATRDRFRDPEGLTVLAAHECLHFYLGGAISPDGEPPYRNSPELVWLMEGVTEYLTFRLLEDAGSLPAGATERAARKKESELAASPEPRISLAEAARRMEETSVYTLVYSRGFLVGRLLEERMNARAPGSFEAALRDLFRGHNFYATRRTVGSDEVRAVFEARCPGIGEVIDRYATGGERLPPAGNAEDSAPRPATSPGKGPRAPQSTNGAG